MIVMIGKRTLDDEKLAVITFTGPFSKTLEVLEEVSDFVSSNDKLEADGDPTVIFYTAPLKDEGRYDVGIPVKGESEGDGKVKIVTIPGHTVIFTEYSEDREEAYRKLIEYVEENRLDVIGAPREILHGDVREIQFPVVL
ncbi:transcriptional regulator [Methanothermobacter thermautotrophicus]|nr:transcriptional regulator [Methanothermobacter thermautotrophicus]